MSAFKEYTHFVPSLEVYPRVFYFNKRYNDFREKFNKFADKYRNVLDVLDGKKVEARKNCFEHGLIVKVIGKEDLDPKAFVATEPHLYKIIPSSTSPEKDADCIVPVNPHQDKVRASSASVKRDLTSSARDSVAKDFDVKSPISAKPTVIICNAKVESLNDEGSQEVERLWNYVSSTEDAHECFLLCRSTNEFTSAEEGAFRNKIKKFFKDDQLIYPIFIGTSTVEIKDEVSLHLEGQLAHYFVTVQSVLKHFTKGPKGNNSSKPLLEEETVAKQIEGVFENGLELTDKRTCNDNVISKLSHIVKCLITQPLSEKHCMPVGFCNHILIRHDFERNMTSKFSEEMRYHLGKFEPIVMQWRKQFKVPSKSFQNKYFHFLLNSLQKDQADVVSDMERVFKQFSTTVRKLLFEVSSCLKKMKVSKEQIKEMEQQAPKQVDTDLRKEILSLKEVYGVGTIYGRLEVHVNSEKAIEEVGPVVRDLLRKNNVFCPFNVKAIESNVELFADSHYTYEHGERIECTTGAGTLAGFVDGSDEKLYGLTCAHVVKGPAEEECDVFMINGSSNQRVLFAKSLPHLIVSTGEETRPLIDLAALRVFDNMQDKCTKFLKDDNCMLYPGVLAADTTAELAGDSVYKHGAITQCTKGLVCSDDYNMLSRDEMNYIMLIDNYDEDGVPFAKPGDSGSMICTPDENEVYIVKAVGILSGGKFTPVQEETPKYFSFRLIDGLRKLTTKAGGVEFSFPLVD